MSIDLTDEIRNKHFAAPLKSEEMKYFTEHFALAVLRFCLEGFDDWFVADSPDLQSHDKTSGIEVTELAIDINRAIVGDCLQYWETGDIKYKNKAESRGAASGDMYYILPAVDSNDELSAFETIFRKKLKKIGNYKKNGFNRLGLIIVMDGIPISSTSRYWSDIVRVLQSAAAEKYDKVYFSYTSVLSCYNCITGETININIKTNDYEALKKLARIETEKSNVKNKHKPRST